jgi:iron complex outermembrane receptor protein
VKYQVIVAAGGLALFVSGSGWAQQAETAPQDTSTALQEITVTAEHRSENLQKTAASVDVVGQDALVNNNVVDVSDLTKLVPALTSIPFVGPYANFTIRGMSNYATNDFNDNAIVVNENGVPLVHPTGAHGLFYDLERVEVLKGPQGTQYGRNATGGVINVIPAAPTSEFGGSFDANFGNFGLRDFAGAINIPLSEVFSVRLAGTSVRRDGFYADGTSDEHSDAGRISMRFKPNENLSATLVLDVDKDQGVGNGAALLNRNGKGYVDAAPWAGVNVNNPTNNAYFKAAGATPRNSALNPPFEDNTFWGATLDVEWTTPIGTVTVLPAHREVSLSYLSDLPTFYTSEDNHSRQDSLEMRLASPDDYKLRYLVGAFYLHDILTGHSDIEQVPNLTNSYLDMSTRTVASFAQLTYVPIDTLRISGSARWNDDYKTTDDTRSTLAGFPFTTQPIYPLTNATGIQPIDLDAARSWVSVTWKGGVDFDLTPSTLLYANVSTGFKAGGFYFGPPTRDSYLPEKVTSYVVGEKSRFLDNKLQVNAEGYLLKYSNQQIAHFAVVPGSGNVNVVDNVGKATIKGIDIDARYLATRLTTVNLSMSFEHAIYNSFTYNSATNITGQVDCPIAPATGATGGFVVNCSGHSMPQAPSWVAQGGIDQVIPIVGDNQLIASLSGRHEAGHQTSQSFVPQAVIPAYSRGDAALTFQPAKGRYTVTAYCDNIGNNIDIESIIPGRSYNQNTGGLIAAVLLPPRTYGVRFHFKY